MGNARGILCFKIILFLFSLTTLAAWFLKRFGDSRRRNERPEVVVERPKPRPFSRRFEQTMVAVREQKIFSYQCFHKYFHATSFRIMSLPVFPYRVTGYGRYLLYLFKALKFKNEIYIAKYYSWWMNDESLRTLIRVADLLSLFVSLGLLIIILVMIKRLPTLLWRKTCLWNRLSDEGLLLVQSLVVYSGPPNTLNQMQEFNILMHFILNWLLSSPSSLFFPMFSDDSWHDAASHVNWGLQEIEVKCH